MSRKTWACGEPLDDQWQSQLREAIKQFGEKQIVKLLGVNMISIARAAAGFGLRKGTAHLIQSKLAAAVEEQQRAA
ncbi:MAG: hypothetical protein V4550_18375 [Gemmatimonadota bacterium]